MKKIFLALIFLIQTQAFSQGVDPSVNPPVNTDEEEVTDGDENENGQLFFPMINYNFSGGKGAGAGLTPIVNYGWSKNIPIKGKFSLELAVNPYVAGQINTNDSSQFLPALMLPGIGGMKLNLVVNVKLGENLTLGLAPVNFGLKLLTSFSDSSNTILQHNIRHAIAIKYSESLIVTGQFTTAWHNLTSDSEKNYKTILNQDKTSIKYWVVSVQTKITGKTSKTPAYLFAEWRSFVGKSTYNSFPNRRILSLGLRSDINFERGMPAANYRRSLSL